MKVIRAFLVLCLIQAQHIIGLEEECSNRNKANVKTKCYFDWCWGQNSWAETHHPSIQHPHLVIFQFL